MRDESHRVVGLSISSMSGGNTVSDNPELSGTAQGSEGVNDYAEIAFDVLPQPEEGGREDYARLITDGGEPGTRPREAGPWKRAGRSEGGWTLIDE